MKNLVSAAACFLLVLPAVSCRSVQRLPRPSDLSPAQLKMMSQALELAKKQEFLKAAEIYDELARLLRGRRPETMMLFNAGSSYREAGRCGLSVSRYSRLLELSLKKQPAFAARGLLEISFSYECLGDSKAVFLALRDARAFEDYMPLDLSAVLWVARIGIALARQGRIGPAEESKSKALTLTLQLKEAYSSEREMRERLSRIFYLMGRSYISKEALKKNGRLKAFLQALPHYQAYLLQSVFLSGGSWTKLAERELSRVFEKLQSALRASKSGQEHKKAVLAALEEGAGLAEKEKSKKWRDFYRERTKKILAAI